MKTVENRFWSKVDKSGDCWEWKAAKLPFGYGLFGYKGKSVKAHRFSWELSNGEIHYDLLVCHKCDNPSCVNPNHLFLGTHKDNFNDMVEKGRGTIEVKLTEQIVKKMVVLYNSHLGIRMRHLANEFGVDSVTVSSMLTKKTWKSIVWENKKTGENHIHWLDKNGFDKLSPEELTYWRELINKDRSNDKRTKVYRN